jgi:hypothetical protein
MHHYFKNSLPVLVLLLSTLASAQPQGPQEKNLVACKTKLLALQTKQASVEQDYFSSALKKEPFTPTAEYKTGEDYCRSACDGIDSQYNAAIDKVFSKKESELNAEERFVRTNCEQVEDKKPGCAGKDCCKVLSYRIDEDFKITDDQTGKPTDKYNDEMIDAVGGLCGQIYDIRTVNDEGIHAQFYSGILSASAVEKVDACPWVKKRKKILALYDQLTALDEEIDDQQKLCNTIEMKIGGKANVDPSKVDSEQQNPKPSTTDAGLPVRPVPAARDATSVTK